MKKWIFLGLLLTYLRAREQSLKKRKMLTTQISENNNGVITNDPPPNKHPSNLITSPGVQAVSKWMIDFT